MKKSLLVFITFLLFAIISTGCSNNQKWEDFKGGIQLLLEVESIGDQETDERNANTIKEIIIQILDEFNVKTKLIRVQKKSTIAVQLPPFNQIERIVNLIVKPARVEFRVVEDESLKNNPDVEELHFAASENTLLVRTKALMNNEYLKDVNVQIDSNSNQPYILLGFNDNGARLFSNITSENLNKRIAIVIDNRIHSAPVVRERITGGVAMVTGKFSVPEAVDLSIVLKYGAFPAKVTLIEAKQLEYDFWFGKSESKT
jgi:preprotein translocase subunit SecD